MKWAVRHPKTDAPIVYQWSSSLSTTLGREVALPTPTTTPLRLTHAAPETVAEGQLTERLAAACSKQCRSTWCYQGQEARHSET